MREPSSKGSVLPDGKLINDLRIQKGLTLEEFAAKSGVGQRTIQSAIKGERVRIDTLRILAESLDKKYEDLLADRPPVAPPGPTPNQMHLVFQIDPSRIKSDPQLAASVRDLISALQRMLPDNAGLCVLATLAGGVVIGAERTEANEVALASDEMKEQLAAIGARQPSLLQGGLLEGEGFSPPEAPSFDIPETMVVLGEDSPNPYMSVAESYYEREVASNQPGAKSWDGLTGVERLEYFIGHKITFLDGFSEGDWLPIFDSLLKGSGLSLARSTPKELFDFARAEMALIGKPYPSPEVNDEASEDRHRRLWKLAHYSLNRDMLDQLRGFLAKAKR